GAGARACRTSPSPRMRRRAAPCPAEPAAPGMRRSPRRVRFGRSAARVRSGAMRSRPEIEIKVPVTVHPGDRVRVGVTLTSGSETPIDFVRIALRCVAVIRHQASSHHELVRRRFELSEQVEGAGELAEGTHRYEATFLLPADA